MIDLLLSMMVMLGPPRWDIDCTAPVHYTSSNIRHQEGSMMLDSWWQSVTSRTDYHQCRVASMWWCVKWWLCIEFATCSILTHLFLQQGCWALPWLMGCWMLAHPPISHLYHEFGFQWCARGRMENLWEVWKRKEKYPIKGAVKDSQLMKAIEHHVCLVSKMMHQSMHIILLTAVYCYHADLPFPEI